MEDDRTAQDLLTSHETDALRKIWNSGGKIKVTGWENVDLDWYGLWEKDYVTKHIDKSGNQPVYTIELTARGQMLATVLFEPKPLCPHCGKPIS